MVSLIFLLVIVAVFAVVLAIEGDGHTFERRPAGLMTWIASGNWPAKIGGGLMIVGVGALLRYAAINLEIPAIAKLAIGLAAAAALGVGSLLTAGKPERRAVSLAFGGAAFGVTYLTAYSAYALFGYLPGLQGLGFLALTALGAGIFAVSRSALSLAVLSMVGAFMAPAFAVDDPGPVVVYGYYCAISLLILLMVSLRGWRPLIHLSFLFTLAGGVFFAWTSGYFSRAEAGNMLPLLVVLVAIHVAMPLAERRHARNGAVESLDTLYLLTLPVVAALTALAVAPSREALSLELWCFSGLWLLAAVYLFVGRREGMASHAIIALLLCGFGLAARFRDLPWELVTLGIAVTALALAARRSASSRLHGFLAGLVLVLGAVQMLSALAPATGTTLFFNGRFAERLLGAALLIVAGVICGRLRQTLDTLLLTVGIGWAAFAVGAEVTRLDLVSASLVLHWAAATAGVALYFLCVRIPRLQQYVVPLVVTIGLSAVLAQFKASAMLAWVSCALCSGALLAVAMRPPSADETGSGRLLAVVAAPILAAVWAARAVHEQGFSQWQLPMAVAALLALAVLLAGARMRGRSEYWLDGAADIFAVSFTFVLAAATVFDIEREAGAVVLELACVAGLVLIAAWNGTRISAQPWVAPAAVIGAALMLQANLLRAMGPPGELNALDIANMAWPTLVSLLWAAIGAGLTIWARRVASRTLWMAGAVFLVGAAVKLLLLDFGSLGQLANILAVIAAGGVFLLVGWLAPMPPAAPVVEPPAPAPTPAPAPATAAPSAAAPSAAAPVLQSQNTGRNPEHQYAARRVVREQDSGRKFAWTVALVTIVLLTLSRCGPELIENTGKIVDMNR